MLTAEKNCQFNSPKVIHKSTEEHIRWLEKRSDQAVGSDSQQGEAGKMTSTPQAPAINAFDFCVVATTTSRRH
jgi:hypothetical protein